MDTLTVATLIEALGLVGQVYRNKDGSQPADAVKKLLEQLKGAGDMTLADWVRSRQPKPKAAPAGQGKKKARAAQAQAPAGTIDEALAALNRADTQEALHDAMAALALSAGQWMSLARQLTGRPASSGKAAREAVETYFSDRLLLDERIKGVRRQFG